MYSYIRPHLEYCAPSWLPYLPSWLPYLAKDIDALEWVQHRTPKLINSFSTLPYEERSVSLQLVTLVHAVDNTVT